ncbi:MAG: hypothetical protein LBQ87_02960 [Candidatus Fibromonas sp.]|jgi:hypothetical protein|nr:hypothetical protein [Candidatus Fibromonas sp.]
MKIIAILIFFFFFCVNAQEAGEDSLVVDIEQKNILLTIVSWPFVHIVQPAVEFLMYPVIPPLLYVSRENLIEKVANLITYGENRQIMFYPIINAKIGSSANIGFAYWHSELFIDNDRLFFSPHLYVNSDWDATVRYQKRKILGTSFYLGLNSSLRADGDNTFRDTKGTIHYFADSSFTLNVYSGFNLTGNWGLEFGLSTNFYRFDLPNINIGYEILENDSARGFYQKFNVYPLTLFLLYNSLDEPYSATIGRKFSLGYSYVPVSAYNSSGDHNYHIVESRFVNYLLLGNRSYTMTIAESNANREKLKNLTFEEAIEMLKPISIKERRLDMDRRVLVTQLKFRYMIEENDGQAPFTAMSRLGGDFPLRAYPDSYFNAPLVAGLSFEYRWPLDRFVDALIFNEYGIYDNDFSHLQISNLKNSYGFGFRVRTSQLFITRFALAFHGSQGISLILTTKPEYE